MRFTLGLLSLFLAPALLNAADAPRPNIVFIMADDLGYSDLGCYGGEIRTPHLDRLASGGLRFRNFYNESKCTESRTALMTGSTHHVASNLRNRDIPTVAELMKQADYQTLMVGKWHLADTPMDRGFDRYFGFLNGAVNFWTGVPSGGDKRLQWRLDDEKFQVPEEGFYTTDAFTDRAMEFIDEAADNGRPFFLYLAHNAPHYPLHAWPEDIARYRGRYAGGWDKLRAERFERMKELEVISADSKLSERDPLVPAWDQLTADEKNEYELLMAVYAAMVDRLDQNIGRLMAKLEELEIADNTLVLFCSDNGGCPYQNEEKPNSIPGGPESHRTYNTPWANASNTPFRLYKRYSHEGGTSSPLIAHWPNGIQSKGEFTDQAGHLIDMLPTFLELAGAEVPEQVAGISLLPALQGNPFERPKPLFWEFMKHHAVLSGDFKLVAESGHDWSLYNLRNDRIESNDLSDSMPEKVKALSAAYDQWAASAGAPSHQNCLNSRPMRMKDYTEVLGQATVDQ